MIFRDQLDFGVRRVLFRRDATLLDRFDGLDGPFRDEALAAVFAAFREDEPNGRLAALLQWIVDHQDEIIAIVKLFMVLAAL